MSGIFGIFNLPQREQAEQFLEQAARLLTHMPWHECEIWSAPAGAEGAPAGTGFGRMHIGLLNRAPQPHRDPTGPCQVWLSGELYNRRELATELEQLGQLAPAAGQDGSSDPALAAAAYRAFGPGFASRLNGAFFIAVYDQARQQVVLTNDRYGLYPHYYSLNAGKLAFAPEVKAVLAAPWVQRELDFTAACEYVRYQHLLGERTFHAGVSMFPYGSWARFDLRRGEWQVERYWDWDAVPYRPEISFDDAAEQTGSLLARAVQRTAAGPLRPGVFLSGGLDSRALLGLMPAREHPPVSATFGQAGSRDVIYAHQIARAAGSRHFWFDLPDGSWVPQYAGLHLQLTEGFHSWIHMHGITMLDDLRPHMDVNLSGWDGGSVMGHPELILPAINQPVDEQTLALLTHHLFTQEYTWPGLTDAEERLLFAPPYQQQGPGRAFDSLAGAFSRFWNFRPEYAHEWFFITQHDWRFTSNMVTMTRAAMEVRAPFWDYDLIDFMYSLPSHIRRDRLMYRQLITQRMPRLANIPDEKDDFLPTLSPLRGQLHRQAVRALKRLRVFPNRTRLYADYENYLRGELRPWAEGILFDRRTTGRGIFNPKFVRSLMERHAAGYEPWTLGKIAPLITFEMMMRAYFD